MKAMILAAGIGSRMRPLTDTLPKPLLQVKGQPLIVHTIRALAQAGINAIVINVHYQAQQIIDYLGDGAQYGVQIHYSLEVELLDTGGGVKQALPLLGDHPFLVVSADVYTDFPFAKLTTVSPQLAHLVMVDNPDFHQHGDYALRNGVLSMLGKNKLTYANIGVLQPALFAADLYAAAMPAAESAVMPKFFPLNILFREAIRRCEVSGEHYTGDWYNIGTPELLDAVNADIT